MTVHTLHSDIGAISFTVMGERVQVRLMEMGVVVFEAVRTRPEARTLFREYKARGYIEP